MTLDEVKYMTISHICERRLKYYEDFSASSERLKFCQELGISYLPSTDRRHIWQIGKGKPQRMRPEEELLCNPYDRIFDEATLEKFGSGNHDEVMFVQEDGIIRGVVHISDYNHELVFVSLYQLLHRFERGIRELLHTKKYSNADLIAWLRKKASQDDTWKRKLAEHCPNNEEKLRIKEEQRRNCSPFQTFYLLELMGFACEFNLFSKDVVDQIRQINQLRNRVMHHNEAAKKKSYREDGPLYRMDELKAFVEDLSSFFSAYLELSDVLAKSELEAHAGGYGVRL